MILSRFIPGDRLRLRETLHYGHSQVRYDERCLSRSALPTGSPAIVRATHATEILVQIITDPTVMNDKGTDVWVPLHMMTVLFESAASTGPDAKKVHAFDQSKSTYV